jgi:hypothetical protein
MAENKFTAELGSVRQKIAEKQRLVSALEIVDRLERISDSVADDSDARFHLPFSSAPTSTEDVWN